MSVTSQLRNKRGPLWEFFDTHSCYEGIQSITTELRASSAPTKPPYDGSYKYSVVGTAFPYAAHTLLPKNKLHHSLSPYNHLSSIAYKLAEYRHPIYWEYTVLIDSLLSLANDMLTLNKDVHSISKGAIILAILEITARGGALPAQLTNRYYDSEDIQECIENYLSIDLDYEPLIKDLHALTQAFIKANKPSSNVFKNAKYYCFDKTLMHSQAVGGADIDVAFTRGSAISIVDYKTLLKPLDYNATRQLLTYALLWNRCWEGDNRNLAHLGIYYTRVSELKEISVVRAFKLAFPDTATLRKTRNTLIDTFTQYAEKTDIMNEARSMADLRDILGH